jgi:hypothetical protein
MKNNKQSIGDLGQHWTPNEIVDKMISLKRNTGKTLEPSAGSGRFVNKIKDITAIEIDKNVVPSDLLSVYNIINFFDYPEYHKFDTVIGNPPYVAGNLLLIEWFSNWKGVCPRTANSYLHFIDKCINHLSENGEIIFIIPSTFFSDTSRGKELRKKMVKLGAFTDVFYCSDVKWEKASIDTLIFRWEKGLKQDTVLTNRGNKTLFESNGFIWLIDFEPISSMNEWFKPTVGSVPSRIAIETGGPTKYFCNGQMIGVDESNKKTWSRVHDTKYGPKIFFNGGPCRRWPMIYSGNYDKHLNHVLLPKKELNIEIIESALNDWFKKNGEKLGLIKGGRWSCGIGQIDNCPIDKELNQVFNDSLLNKGEVNEGQ